MSKELTELKNIADSFFAKAEAFVKTIKAQESSSDQHLLDDGWIRHTGDACPVHELDEVIYRVGKDVSEMSFKAGVLNWNNAGITHYKITKKYAPQPKKQLIDWSHPYFKRCAADWVELTQAEKIDEAFPNATDRLLERLKEIYGSDFATAAITVLVHNDSGATLINHFYPNQHALKEAP